MCNIKIHETQPLLNLKLDRVMQDIVYKLVPGLQESMSKQLLGLFKPFQPDLIGLWQWDVFTYLHNVYIFLSFCSTGEDKRIKEFYQSRGLERVIQPAGDGKCYSRLCFR